MSFPRPTFDGACDVAAVREQFPILKRTVNDRIAPLPGAAPSTFSQLAPDRRSMTRA